MRKWPIPQRIRHADAEELTRRFHAYAGMGSAGECWGCVEDGRVVAAWAWQPPPPGCAKSLCPDMPGGVLALSRMVAVPKSERNWHISKPLRWIMRRGLDRVRWPVLVTFADTSVGHSGHVYVCSGWQRAGETKRPVYVDSAGVRRSTYSAGMHSRDGLTRAGSAVLIRFVHRACTPGEERARAEAAGWRQVETGRRWRSGNKAKKWIQPGLEPTTESD